MEIVHIQIYQDSCGNWKQTCRIKQKWSQALVAHTLNPSYLGGWDQEDGD
jgi:hypothetical protein